jgi:hypothetical protein
MRFFGFDSVKPIDHLISPGSVALPAVVEGSACEVVLQHQYIKKINLVCRDRRVKDCQDRRTGIGVRKVRAFDYDACRQAGDSRAGGTYLAWPMMGRANPTPTGRNGSSTLSRRSDQWPDGIKVVHTIVRLRTKVFQCTSFYYFS